MSQKAAQEEKKIDIQTYVNKRECVEYRFRNSYCKEHSHLNTPCSYIIKPLKDEYILLHGIFECVTINEQMMICSSKPSKAIKMMAEQYKIKCGDGDYVAVRNQVIVRNNHDYFLAGCVVWLNQMACSGTFGMFCTLCMILRQHNDKYISGSCRKMLKSNYRSSLIAGLVGDPSKSVDFLNKNARISNVEINQTIERLLPSHGSFVVSNFKFN